MEKKGAGVTRQVGLSACFALCCVVIAGAQATSNAVVPLLKQNLQSPALVADELKHFMLTRVPALPAANNAGDWTREAEGLRAHELEVIFHGWPREWVEAKPKFEKVAVIERAGYRIVKLRYEIVPGIESTALLYEPEHLTGKMPAILDVHGHGPGGKAVEHLQKRCINQARRGILALSLEWMGYGELRGTENAHDKIGLLDLAGANGVGLFYLAMRRGLDYLYEDPRVDRTRIGMTGLSGGGWQTMLLSSLDERVGPAVPVAGFSSLTTAIEHPEYAGDDAEQNAPDLRSIADYAQLMALRAPRPTLLIYNSMDDCCFRAGVVKQGVYSDMQAYFRMMGSAGSLEWYENETPGTHNYHINSRERAYKFFDSAFGLKVSDTEDADTDSEVLSEAELAVGVAKNNQTIEGLAREMAKAIHHELPARTDAAWVDAERKKLREVVRYSAVTLTHAWPVSATHENNLESRGYRFEFSDGLSATGVLLQSSVRPRNGGLTVLIADAGRARMMDQAGNDVNRGRRVLVLEPLFFGENIPGTSEQPGVAAYAQMINTVGKRPVGLEAAQIAAVVHWLQGDTIDGTSTPGASGAGLGSAAAVQVVTSGPRAETVAMVAAALTPELFSGVEARHGLASFGDVFEHPLSYEAAPELMCLDLYKEFDFNVLSAIAAPVKIELQGKDAEVIFW